MRSGPDPPFAAPVPSERTSHRAAGCPIALVLNPPPPPPFARALGAAGQVALSPNSTGQDCPTLFGWATPGSSPPPYGSGTLHMYDEAKLNYTVTYSPSSFEITGMSCTLTFSAPALNSKSGGSLHKIVRVEGECTEPLDLCSRSYWVANASDYLVFMDAAPAVPCPAFFFRINPGSSSGSGGSGGSGSGSGSGSSGGSGGSGGSSGSSGGSGGSSSGSGGSFGSFGSFGLVAVANEGRFEETPPLLTGDYFNQDVYWRVALRLDSCQQSYEVDLETLSLVSFSEGATPAGSASVAFIKAVPAASCPTACVTAGYNAFWDASGTPINPPPLLHSHSAYPCGGPALASESADCSQ
jgi:hypothetical protein